MKFNPFSIWIKPDGSNYYGFGILEIEGYGEDEMNYSLFGAQVYRDEEDNDGRAVLQIDLFWRVFTFNF